MSTIYGITDPVISVKIDNEKLAEKQVPLQSVMGVLQGQNTALLLVKKSLMEKQVILKSLAI